MKPSRTTMWRRHRAALAMLEKEVESVMLSADRASPNHSQDQDLPVLSPVASQQSRNRNSAEELHSEIEQLPMQASVPAQSVEFNGTRTNLQSSEDMDLSDSEGSMVHQHWLLELQPRSPTDDSNAADVLPHISDYDDTYADETNKNVLANKDDEAEQLRKELAAIKCKYKIPHAAITEVSKLFRKYTNLEIPTDARAICKTDLSRIDNESYVYFGLKDSIRRIVISHSSTTSVLPRTLELHMFTDGVKLYNNSAKVFWPIICSIVNIGDSEPFVVACYCGDSKPPSLECFLQPFVDEYNQCKDSLIIGNRTYVIVLKAIIADAQARSFIKRIKGQCGYGGCERCITSGEMVGNTMVFLEFDADLRTDHSFREQEDDRHHTGTSPLKYIKDFDTIYHSPYEYMHLVCLGSCKRLLSQLWVGTDARRPHRFSIAQTRMFNSGILKCAESLPTEFKRKGRVHTELRLWKAVEYRTFLLYTGPIILKPILSTEKYEQFLYFHVGIRILCSKDLTPETISFADQCLRYSVYKLSQLYGVNQMVFCNHSLIHLAKDCEVQNGNLDSFSAFRFESYLGKLKGLIKGKKKPLVQLKRRLSELQQVKLCDERVGDMFIPEKGSPSFEAINPGKPKDSYCMSQCGIVYKIKKVTRETVIGEILHRSLKNRHQFEEFFSLELEGDMEYKASELRIFVVKNNGRPFREHISVFKNVIKCAAFKRDETTSVIYPLLHHIN